ncbi:1,4-dihydroxy-2-naphthoate polyprenyltransferase [Streptococcus hillyeri]|uniref:1,4-dihydroxy-2-naphthoate polyprenyltransferase n=1 Tax=Streptococcus hillyeri TaxID=2282420 RepID=A0A3L9E074_9STRE|nr:1,4-dihydroxy-2-naphthoate polyprenyltransferase [Streptococcus hillyeri]RLY05369.1 1,4-dihydroxy-2-naphthoate polyprenyltransferase [Streptococcus hillyeri]
MSTKHNALTLPIFLEFVELRTKVASVFPMFIGIFWAVYHYKTFNLVNTLLFILAAITFDMCTTAINNTMDYKKALDTDYKEQENVIGANKLNFQQMVHIIFALLGFSVLISLILVWRTDIILLPIGILCFLIGIFYTFGPMPLSRLPLGELFSGVTMGFGIFFLAIFIQKPDLLVSSLLTASAYQINLAWLEIIQIAVLSLPLICLIANIMLANNLCDYEQDIKNGRYTLVHYIGKARGVTLYTVLNLMPWMLWVIYPLAGLLPKWTWLGLVLVIINVTFLKAFRKEQVKRLTFINAIKSFVLFSGLYLISLVIATII